MKKGDIIWLLALIGVITFMIAPATHDVFIKLTMAHPYFAGFIKFLILATMGELLAIRITGGDWKSPRGLLWRAMIWGIIGMTIVLMFECFAYGTKGVLEKGLLPGYGSPYVFAFFVSTLLNCSFGSVFMAAHRISDTFLDLKFDKENTNKTVSFKQVLEKISWADFISFVICRTIPLFWIPAHTVTFLLPSEYRVLMAAFLGIALGGILGFAKKRSTKLVVKSGVGSVDSGR